MKLHTFQRRRSIILVTIAFLLWVSPCLSQELDPESVLRVNTDLVGLDVMVIDKKTGRPVRDLTKNDFELYVDGSRQEITFFSQDQLPLSVLLLLDVSGSVRPIIEEIGEGARNALDMLKPNDEVAVMAFADRPKLVQPFTSDRQLILVKIGEASKTDELGKATFVNDALGSATREMIKAANPVSRRVVLVVTDNISSQFGADKELLAYLLESGIVVYGLVVRSTIAKVANVFTLGKLHGLDPYSEATGGELLGAKKEEVDKRMIEAIDHLRARYSMGFKPSDTNADGKLHQIKLKLTAATVKSRGKLAVRTRTGYYLLRR